MASEPSPREVKNGWLALAPDARWAGWGKTPEAARADWHRAQRRHMMGLMLYQNRVSAERCTAQVRTVLRKDGSSGE